MTAVGRRLDGWLLAPAPPERLAALRLLVGGFALTHLVLRFRGFWSAPGLPRRQWDPVGVLAPLSSPLPAPVARVALIVVMAGGVAFVLGFRWRVVGPAFALGFLAITTYRLSWGHVIHTEHLVAITLLLVGVSRSADAWSLDRRAGRRHPVPPGGPSNPYGWPVKAMMLVVVVSYVLAGLAKVRNGGTDWLVGDVLRNQIAYDNLRKELLGDVHSPIGAWAVGHGALFVPLAVATVIVELGAPVALLGGRWRTVWVALAWGFHVGIAVLMAISFPYQLCGIAYAPFFRIERLVGVVGRRLEPVGRRLRLTSGAVLTPPPAGR